jgi:hypothetical protein
MNRIIDRLMEDPMNRVPQILGRASGLAHDARLPSTTKAVLSERDSVITYLEEAAKSLGFPPRR